MFCFNHGNFIIFLTVQCIQYGLQTYKGQGKFSDFDHAYHWELLLFLMESAQGLEAILKYILHNVVLIDNYQILIDNYHSNWQHPSLIAVI